LAEILEIQHSKSAKEKRCGRCDILLESAVKCGKGILKNQMLCLHCAVKRSLISIDQMDNYLKNQLRKVLTK